MDAFGIDAEDGRVFVFADLPQAARDHRDEQLFERRVGRHLDGVGLARPGAVAEQESARALGRARSSGAQRQRFEQFEGELRGIAGIAGSRRERERANGDGPPRRAQLAGFERETDLVVVLAQQAGLARDRNLEGGRERPSRNLRCDQRAQLRIGNAREVGRVAREHGVDGHGLASAHVGESRHGLHRHATDAPHAQREVGAREGEVGRVEVDGALAAAARAPLRQRDEQRVAPQSRDRLGRERQLERGGGGRRARGRGGGPWEGPSLNVC